ncbi:MAG: acyl-CoA dehydrogenase family protein [Gemmatimonadales bacterium]
MTDTRPIRTFLEPHHTALAERARALAMGEIAKRPDPADDTAARKEARVLVGLLGAGGWLQPILDLDLRGCCLMREALGEASPLADAVFALQGLGTTPILLGGTQAQKDRWIGPIAEGRVMTAFAMTEGGAGSDVAAIATTARHEGSGYVITGAKTLISNAGIADLYVVFASTDRAKGAKGISCFLVPANTFGLRFRPQVLSAPHPLGEITFEDCRVPADALLGAEGRGYGIGLAALDRLRPTVAAAACGMAARALAESLAHVKRRQQFGKPLAEFQLVQQKLARMATELTAARLLTYRAAHEKDQGQERITSEAAMAKSFATEMAQRAVDDAVQLIGGRGVLADHPVDRLYRAVRALRIYEGTTEIQQLIIAGELLK